MLILMNDMMCLMLVMCDRLNRNSLMIVSVSSVVLMNYSGCSLWCVV